LRLLTDAAKRTQFDFVWTVEGFGVAPVLAVTMAEDVLRQGIENGLRMHGALDHGLARY
jgi:hypothetical protein